MAATVRSRTAGVAIVAAEMGELDDGSEARDGGAAGPGRPLHLRPTLLGVVWVGGAAGTASRYLVGLAVPRVLGVPVATLLVNLVGAFALGLLLEALVRRGADDGRRRLLRLLLGTGFLGGFTTYSALAVDTVLLLRSGLPGPAWGYAGGTVLAGAVLSLAGVAAGARLGRGPVPAGTAS